MIYGLMFVKINTYYDKLDCLKKKIIKIILGFRLVYFIKQFILLMFILKLIYIF